ncbi:MAG: hypothetical protein JWO93_2746 [Micrococcaceae bacterium]|jgi:hypothetical protein|nr:hypothetical protein [Micrococcaceae bacterium]
MVPVASVVWGPSPAVPSPARSHAGTHFLLSLQPALLRGPKTLGRVWLGVAGLRVGLEPATDKWTDPAVTALACGGPGPMLSPWSRTQIGQPDNANVNVGPPMRRRLVWQRQLRRAPGCCRLGFDAIIGAPSTYSRATENKSLQIRHQQRMNTEARPRQEQMGMKIEEESDACSWLRTRWSAPATAEGPCCPGVKRTGALSLGAGRPGGVSVVR